MTLTTSSESEDARSGETVPAKAAQLSAALDAIRRQQGRILSVTPVRTTLEDYFLKQIGAERYQSAVEVSR